MGHHPGMFSRSFIQPEPHKYQLEAAGFEVKNIDVLGVHYSATIWRWYKNWVSNKDKVIAALTYMDKGDADAWAQLYMQMHAADVAAGRITWTAFLAQLDERFLDPRVAEYVRKVLFKLSQGVQHTNIFFYQVRRTLNQRAVDCRPLRHAACRTPGVRNEPMPRPHCQDFIWE